MRPKTLLSLHREKLTRLLSRPSSSRMSKCFPKTHIDSLINLRRTPTADHPSARALEKLLINLLVRRPRFAQEKSAVLVRRLFVNIIKISNQLLVYKFDAMNAYRMGVWRASVVLATREKRS